MDPQLKETAIPISTLTALGAVQLPSRLLERTSGTHGGEENAHGHGDDAKQLLLRCVSINCGSNFLGPYMRDPIVLGPF